MARFFFLGGGVAFFLWEMAEIWGFGERFELRVALEIALISVFGPAFVWFASATATKLAQETQQRQRELLALNQIMQQMLAERIPLLGEVNETRRHLQVFHQVSEVVGQGLPIGQTADRTLDKILEVMGLEAGEFWLLNPFQGELWLVSQRGLAPEAFWERHRAKLGEGFPGIAAQTQKPLFTSDLAHETRFLRRAVVEAGFTYFAAVPLFSGERVVGALTVASRTRRAPQERELETLISLGRMVAPLLVEIPPPPPTD